MLLRGQSGSTSCRVRLERKAPTSTATWDHSQLLHEAKLAQNRDRLPWSGAWAASFCWGLGLTVLSPQVPLPPAFNNPPQSPTVLLIQQPLCVLWDFFQTFCSISKFLGPSSTLLLKAAAKCRCQLLQGAFPDSLSWQSSLPCLPLSVTRSGKNWEKAKEHGISGVGGGRHLANGPEFFWRCQQCALCDPARRRVQLAPGSGYGRSH